MNILNWLQKKGYNIQSLQYSEPDLGYLVPIRYFRSATSRYIRPSYPMSLKKVAISQKLVTALKQHAKTWKPSESCAMLIGKRGKGSFHVLGAVLCSNPTLSGGYFEIPVKELIKSYEIAEENDMRIVGVFHSHPSGFESPSCTDRHYMKLTPGAWIIYSWTNLRCFTLGSEIEMDVTKKRDNEFVRDISDERFMS